MKSLILAIAVISIFTGCSAKEFNSNIDSISSDIANAYEDVKEGFSEYQ